MKVADGAGVSPLRVSLQKVQCAIQQITLGLEALEGIAGAEVKTGFVNNIMKKLERTAIIPPRRAWSCARGARQPVSKWPGINGRRTSL